MRLYIAGPMTGLPEFNFPAFHAAADALRAAGYEVENPADTGLLDGWDWSDYLRSAVVQLVRSDGVALLPGYHNSTGARLEHKLANDLGMPCRLLRGWLDSAGSYDSFESSAYVRAQSGWASAGEPVAPWRPAPRRSREFLPYPGDGAPW